MCYYHTETQTLHFHYWGKHISMVHSTLSLLRGCVSCHFPTDFTVTWLILSTQKSLIWLILFFPQSVSDDPSCVERQGGERRVRVNRPLSFPFLSTNAHTRARCRQTGERQTERLSRAAREIQQQSDVVSKWRIHVSSPLDPSIRAAVRLTPAAATGTDREDIGETEWGRTHIDWLKCEEASSPAFTSYRQGTILLVSLTLFGCLFLFIYLFLKSTLEYFAEHVQT